MVHIFYWRLCSFSPQFSQNCIGLYLAVTRRRTSQCGSSSRSRSSSSILLAQLIKLVYDMVKKIKLEIIDHFGLHVFFFCVLHKVPELPLEEMKPVWNLTILLSLSPCVIRTRIYLSTYPIMDFELHSTISLRARLLNVLQAPNDIFIQALNRNLNLQRFKVLYICGNYSGTI
jgi:hypothetical protein